MTDSSAGDFDQLVAKFEREWQSGHVPDMCDFVDRQPECNSLSSADRRSLLSELVAVDLEFRWRSPAAAPAPGQSGSHPVERLRVKDYMSSIVEFGDVSVPLMLLVEEYRVRRRWGGLVGHEEFLRRHSERHNELAPLLRDMDEELAADERFPTIPQAREADQIPRSDGQTMLAWSDFVLKQQIGAGGMGKVYRSVQKSSGQTVAIKFLRRALLQFPSAIERFVAEADTLARFQHANIVEIHGLGRTPGGGYFIVMDCINGRNLSDTITSGPVPVAEIARWAADVAEAISHAHSYGVIHCDLKPSNIMISQTGRAVVTDFGLARGFDEGLLRSNQSLEGTAAYMAPEQIDSSLGAISAQTDLYGLGGLLYASLAGRPPRQESRIADILASTMAGTPLPPVSSIRPDVSEVLATLIAECLAWNPFDRPSSAAHVASALRRCVPVNE